MKIARESKEVEQYIQEGRFQISFSLLTAVSGLFTGLEVLYEHLRGSYGQRIMYTPLILSFALFVAGIWGAFSKWAARNVLRSISFLTLIDGVVGFYYHIRGVQRKPGGWRIPIFNVIMGPPVFAPLLFSSVGVLGIVASFLRRETAPHRLATLQMPLRTPAWLRWLPRGITRESIILEQDIRTGRFQRMFAVLTALSAFFSGIEALYSHYKNNFAYRIQWSPIILTPLLMMAGFGAIWSRTIARIFLPLTSALAVLNGLMGFFYHARGVSRRSGGLKKPFYNIMYGPPILAPLLFAASGCIGLLTSLLRREKA
jgi:hypothetical protein